MNSRELDDDTEMEVNTEPVVKVETTAKPEMLTTISGTTKPRRLIIDPNYREKVLAVHRAERARLNATNMMYLVTFTNLLLPI